MALVAAIRPNVCGSSTSGVKKSMVVTTASSSDTRQTAASSRDSFPTISCGARAAAGNPQAPVTATRRAACMRSPRRARALSAASGSPSRKRTGTVVRHYAQAMPEIDPDQAAERVKKLIIVGDNRLKQGGDDKYAKARGTFEQALRLAEEAGIDERFRPFIERRLESIAELRPNSAPSDG